MDPGESPTPRRCRCRSSGDGYRRRPCRDISNHRYTSTSNRFFRPTANGALFGVLDSSELGSQFKVCAADPTAAGRRDAALLAVLYGSGMRSADLAGLDVAHLDPVECSILVRNGKRHKQRTVYLALDGAALIQAWLQVRGEEPGPLFCPHPPEWRGPHPAAR